MNFALSIIGIPSVSYFFSGGCNFANGNFNKTITYSNTCNEETDTEYYYEPTQFYSSVLQCSSSASYRSIIPNTGSIYAVNK